MLNCAQRARLKAALQIKARAAFAARAYSSEYRPVLEAELVLEEITDIGAIGIEFAQIAAVVTVRNQSRHVALAFDENAVEPVGAGRIVDHDIPVAVAEIDTVVAVVTRGAVADQVVVAIRDDSVPGVAIRSRMIDPALG